MEETLGIAKQESASGVEIDAFNAPVKDVAWHATKAQTETVQIKDPGAGKEIVLRHFFFKSSPLPKGTKQPTKLEIINHFKRLIEMSLWGDGLTIREDKPIELHTLKSVKKVSKSLYFKMREEGADFCILVLAQPRSVVLEKAFIAK